MNTPIVFMFSGQGSQYYHMGKEMYACDPVFQKLMRKLDRTAHDLSGHSILGKIHDPNRQAGDPFDRTLYTHPAILMVQYAMAQVLIEGGIAPDYVLGASMGEFAAAVIADVISVENALEAVIRQAETLEEHCPPGGMMAILHSPDIYYDRPLLKKQSEFVGQNFDAHFVISGRRSALQRIEAFLQKEKIACQALPVSQAFHSKRIDPAKSAYMDFLRTVKYQQPNMPILSCANGAELEKYHQGHLWDVVRRRVDFQKTIRMMEGRQPALYIDIGPSGTLANFAKYTFDKSSQSQAFSTLTPFANKSVANVAAVRTHLSKIKRERCRHTHDEHILVRENAMNTWVFPGQGSQMVGMGKDLFDAFKDLTEQADAILGYSVKELCTEDPQQRLNDTRYTQPALFIVNALSYEKEVNASGQKPEYVAGHSLGEYNALYAAGAIDFESGVRLVKKRGELMGRASGGAMAAVINVPEDKLLAVIEQNNLAKVDVANFNSPSQIVISGLKADIDKASDLIKSAGGISIPLKVSAAFHSRYMQPAQDEYERFLEEIAFKEMTMPVISNVTARPYRQSDIAHNLAKQITHSVKWTESIRYLMGKGDINFKEIGPGNVLSKLIDTIRKDTEPLIVEDDVSPPPIKKEPAQNRDAQAEVKEAPSPESRVNTVPAAHSLQQEGIQGPGITPASLGDGAFKREYNLKYAYIAGAMVRGIASKELVVQMGKAGMLGYLGTGGMDLADIETAIQFIQEELRDGQAYGMNLLCNIHDPQKEDAVVDLYLKSGVRNVEASAYMQVTPSLVRYWLKGLKRDSHGTVTPSNRIMAKVSRPEVAQAFLSPAPERIVKKLLDQGAVTQEEAELSKQVPMATAICVESDSGGHTDQGIMVVLLPTIIRLRNELVKEYGYRQKVWIGGAGGIGTPEAAATAFMLGAEFILTGSINQCTVEAGISDAVKDILQDLNVQDTGYAPAGDMFELGAKVQVVRKGIFFPARANRLYDLYRMYNSLDEIDPKTRMQIEEKYFKRSFDEVWRGTKDYFSKTRPQEIELAERNPKHKMALVFRWYFGHTMQLALRGETENKVDFQIHCGPSLGAFNQWVKGTDMEDWHKRSVGRIAEKLMQATADSLNQRFKALQ